MARHIQPLSDTFIRKSKPQEVNYTLYDGGGLQLRILPSGTRTWYFNYVHPLRKKRQNLKLGTYPAVGLADARQLRSEQESLLAQGIDPIEFQKEQRQQQQELREQTLETVARDWFRVKLPAISEKYGFNLQRMFEQHLFPSLGDTPVHKLTAPMVIAALRPLEALKKLETLSRLCQRLNELMVWCVNVGIIEHNRLAGIKAAFLSPRTLHMRTIDVSELPELLTTMRQDHIHLFIRGLFEWQLHTMVRPGEAATACWSEINWQQKIWQIPAHKMKMARTHAVPLSRQMLTLLQKMQAVSGASRYIFPSLASIHEHANKEAVNNTLKRNGFRGRLVAHGLRALASTVLNDRGFDHDVIETALAHSDPNQVRSAYNRAHYLERRRELMQWWSDFLTQQAGGRHCIE